MNMAVIWLVLILVHVSMGYDCVFDLGNSQIDLSSLSKSRGSTFTIVKNGYYYEMNICQDVSSTCHGEIGIATQWENEGNCIAVLGREKPKFGAGVLPTIEYIDNTTPMSGVILKYYNGDVCIDQQYKERQTDIIVHCGESKDGKLLDVYEKEPCHYVFELSAQNGCVIPTGASTAKPKSSNKSTKIIVWSLIGCGAVMSFLILKATENKQENSLRRFLISPVMSIWRVIGGLSILCCGGVNKLLNCIRGREKYNDII